LAKYATEGGEEVREVEEIRAELQELKKRVAALEEKTQPLDVAKLTERLLQECRVTTDDTL